MAKTIRDMLPEKEQTSLVQAKIKQDIFERVKTQMVKDKITWKDLLTASFKRYLDESAKRSS